MHVHICGLGFVLILVHCCLAGMMRSSGGNLVVGRDCAITTSFENTTDNYSSELIALIQELAPLTYEECKTVDVRKLEALMMQQIKF